MGVAQAMEALTERAGLMKESLHKSQTITDNMVGILGSFDHRLSALETAMRPTQVPFSSLCFVFFRVSWNFSRFVESEIYLCWNRNKILVSEKITRDSSLISFEFLAFACDFVFVDKNTFYKESSWEYWQGIESSWGYIGSIWYL